MVEILEILLKIKNTIWSAPLLIFILGTGLYFTFLLRGLQFRYLRYGLYQAFKSHKEKSKGDISHFQSLMTFLAGAIGTGAITGVATGIAIGGMGMLFWMWVTAIFGMVIRYVEALLAVHYREMDSRGEMLGGPMEYIGRGLGWRWMAVLFSIFGVGASLGLGNLVQANAISDAFVNDFAFNSWLVGCIVAVLTGLVLLRGIKSIGFVTAFLVPLMAVFYVVSGLIILALNFHHIPQVFSKIFSEAFTGQAAAGGFIGSTVMVTVRMGVSRAIFSSEAGLGASAIAAAAAKTDHSGRQAMVAMTGVLLSTIVVCTVTGLVMGVMGVVGSTGRSGKLLAGTTLAIEAFRRGIPGGGIIVTVGLVLFAYSTIIAWAYYGEKCIEYIFSERIIPIYRIFFVLLLIPGAVVDLNAVWAIADIFNGLMSLPNLLALVLLSGVVVTETKKFLKVADQEIAQRRKK